MGYNNPIIKKPLPYVSRTTPEVVNTLADKSKQTPTEGGVLNWILDKLQRGNYASANIALDLINGGGFNPIKSGWRGLSGKDKTLYSDVLDEAGVKNKYVKGGLGFILDVALDPTTYLTFGVGASAKLGTKALNVAGRKLLSETAEKIGEKAAKKAMTRVIEETGSKYLAKGGVKFAGKSIIPGEKISRFAEMTRIADVGRGIKKSSVGQTFGRMFIPNFKPAELTDNEWGKLMSLKSAHEEAIQKNSLGIIDDVFRISHQYSKKDRIAMSKAIVGIQKGKTIEESLKGYSDEVVDTAKYLKEKLGDIWTEESQRGLIESFKEGYLPGIYKKIGKGTRWSRPKVFDNPFDAKRAGYELVNEGDAALLYGLRGISSARLTAAKDFYMNVGQTFGIEMTEKEAAQKGLRQLRTIGPAKIMTGKYFQPDIAKAIENMSPHYQEWGTDQFLKFYDKALNFWKGSVTSLFPAFHTRNALSNTWLMYLGGVKNPARLKQSFDMQRLARAMRLDDKAVIEKLGKKKIGNYTYAEIVKQARLTDVMNSGWYGLEISGESAMEKVMNVVGSKGPVKRITSKVAHPLKTGRELGTVVENNARLSLFIDRIAKGDDFISAAQTTKKFLFDYNDLTPFEKTFMKRIVPFYTWMRKNIPLQIEQLAKNPGKFAGIEKLREEINSMSSREKANEKYLPSWIKNEYTIRLPGKSQDGMWRYISPDLAFQDLAKLNILTGSDEEISGLFSMISPFIKAPIEFAANKDIFRRKNLADPNLPSSTRAWEKAKAEIMNNLRIAGVWQRLSDDEKTIVDKTIRELIGMYVYAYDPSVSRKYFYQQKERERKALDTLKKKKK